MGNETFQEEELVIELFDNNDNIVKKPTGCWLCKHLEYYEKYNYESQGYDGWICVINTEVENFKTFPCKRKLKCFVEDKNNGRCE